MSELGLHFGVAARSLRRNLRFSVTAAATLALGIGGISALFSVVGKILLEPLPYADPSRLVQLITTSEVGDERLSAIPKYLFWRDKTSSFEAMAASDTDGPDVNFALPYRRVAVRAGRVSADYFQVLGAKLGMGRGFSEAEDSPGGPKAVVVSDAMWRRYLGASAIAASMEVVLDNIEYRVVGVLAPDAHLEIPAEVWLPLCADRRSTDHIGRVRVIARLKDSVSLKDANKEVSATLLPFQIKYPPTSQAGAPVLFGEVFRAIPLRDAVVGDVRDALYILMGAGAFLLAISCVNTATLLSARATRRTREMAIRLAAGALPRHVLSQVLAEAVLLSSASAVGGIALGYGLVRSLLALAPANLPRIGANGAAISLDWRVFLFTLAGSICAGIVCALLPALTASRTDINVLIKDSTSQSGMSFRRDRWRSHLMTVQVCLSLVLLVGAGLLIRTFFSQRVTDYGFDPNNVVTLEMSLSGPRFEQTTQVAQLAGHLEQEMRRVPSVVSLAATSALPLTPGMPMPFTILKNDHSMLGPYDGTVTWRSVSPQYFDVFRIPLLRGRMFTDGDNPHSPQVAIINRSMARRYWPAANADPIGEFITIGDGLRPGIAQPPIQLVGQVPDVREAGLRPEPSIYVPVAQVSDWMNARNNRLRPIVWVIRIDGIHPSPVAMLQKELGDVSGGQPVGKPRSMRDVIGAAGARNRFYMLMLAAFAGMGLILTVTGLYGLMSYAVEQRMSELAVRTALGASPHDIQLLVVMQALRLTALGAAIGLPLSIALGKITVSSIFGVQSWHPAILGVVALLLCAVSALAAYLPSVRASRVNPASALRS